MDPRVCEGRGSCLAEEDRPPRLQIGTSSSLLSCLAIRIYPFSPATGRHRCEPVVMSSSNAVVGTDLQVEGVVVRPPARRILGR